MLTRREFITHLAVAYVSVRVRPPKPPKPVKPPPPTQPASWIAPGWVSPTLAY